MTGVNAGDNSNPPASDLLPKVVAIEAFRDWRAAGYSKEPFCGDCVRELGSQWA